MDFPDFISGEVGHIEYDYIEAKKVVDRENVLAIVCHPHPLHGGTKDNKVVHTLSRALRDIGVSSIRFNFRGVGKSEGVFDEGRGEFDDLKSVVSFVRELFGEDVRLILAGFSFGSSIAARYCAEHSAEGLVLVAPPVSYSFFPTSDSLAVQTLVVQGDADDVVDSKRVREWAELGESAGIIDIKVMAGAGHFFHGRLPELKQMVQGVIESSLRMF